MKFGSGPANWQDILPVEIPPQFAALDPNASQNQSFAQEQKDGENSGTGQEDGKCLFNFLVYFVQWL